MNLLVTGGAGFIGANFLRTIANECAITRLVNLDCLTYAGHLENLASVRFNFPYTFEQVDLRNLPDVRRVIRDHEITHVVHIAAESQVDRSIAAPAHFVTTNVLGTFNLLEACRATPRFRRFLHVSTDEVYGSLGPTGSFTEASPYAPNSPYSATKASSDMLVRAYHRTYGMDAIITNCSNNYGPYQYPEKLIPVVIQSALQRKPIPIFGDGSQVRDWLYVADHASALWKVLIEGRAGESYNIGARKELSNLALVRLICDLVDPSAKELITFVTDRRGHDQRYSIDPGKIERELRWSPKHEFATALSNTVQWYKENQLWLSRIVSEQTS